MIERGEIPKEFTYQDDTIMVFPDIHPVAPVHLLIVPRRHIPDFFDNKDQKTHMAIVAAIHKLIEREKLMGKGYNIEVNGGGRQIVPHLHFHLIGPVGVYNPSS
jgi:histidine triad (HIT) family protein